MSEWIGRTLSKVVLEKLVGRGGMADVYLGRHTTLNRPVAVKVLQPHLVEDETQLKRFTTEAQAIAAMRHPYIVQVFDFDVVDDRPYIVMELLPGSSLKDYLQALGTLERRVPARTAARLIAQISSALDYAHQRGIIHRDIKPANVMLRHEGGSINLAGPLPDDVEAVLTDFGVARIADAAGATASGMIVGTPAYMSPEQVRGGAIDSRTDIYSMGVMLYEMLSGELPFEGETQASLLIKHMTEMPKPLRDATPEIQAVLNRALAKDPGDRFQTATELSNALNGALGLPLGAVPVPLDASTQPLSRPRSVEDTASTAVLEGSPEVLETRPGRKEATGQLAASPRKTNPLVIAGSAAGVLALALVILGLAGVFGGKQVEEAPATEPAAGGEATEAASLPPPETAEAPTVAATDQPTPTGPAAVPASVPRGQVTFTDAVLTALLDEIDPPPDGSVYEAWLADEANPPLSLGVIQVVNGKASVAYADPNGANILATYGAFVLSVEPASDGDPAMSGHIAYEGRVDADLLARIRLMNDKAGGTPLKPTVVDALPTQGEQYDNHLGYSVEAIFGNDLPGGKAHAEHLINIAVGEGSPDFGDWDGNGRAENPGDGVGLETYLRILAAASDGSPEAEELRDRVEEALIVLQDAVELAHRITVVDSIDEAKTLAPDLPGLVLKRTVTSLAQVAEDLNLAIRVDVLAVP